MSDTHVIIPNMGSSNHGESESLNSNIKEEVVRDEDILLFTSGEMDEFSGDANNFQFVEEMVDNTDSMSNGMSFNIQSFDENQMNQLISADNFAKFPTNLAQMCKMEPPKNENYNHFIKYKLQDGKHSKVWECGICAKEFGHQYTLMRHLPTHTDERKFQCNTCGKAFRQMSTLSQHRAIHSAERPYICEICHKTFNRVSTLISHRKTHTGLKPHRCHLCNKAFHQKGNLRNHIFTHTNERPYKCDICTKGFNQMSNLMCHKIKAHHRSDKPRYVCQICGKDFQKRIGLRNHEQHQHGVQNVDPITSNSPLTRIKYTNGVLIDPINTTAMQHALATNQTPFALLRPLNGIPVLVRVLAAGDKQMLVPATAEDLKKHGQITITTQMYDDNNKEIPEEPPEEKVSDDNAKAKSQKGSTVQIKIPVVATVVQCCGKDGNVCMVVQNPGPNNGTLNEDYIFTTTNNDITGEGNVADNFQQAFDATNNFSELAENNNNHTSQIQYVDECGNLVSEEESKASNEFEFSQQASDDSVINLQDKEEMFAQNNIIDIQSSYIQQSGTEPTLQILEKPQLISLNEANNILDASNLLCNNGNGGISYDIVC